MGKCCSVHVVVRQKRGGMPLLGRGWFTHPLVGWVRQIGEPLSIGSCGWFTHPLLQFLRSKSSSWHRSHLFLAPYVPDPAGFRSSNQNQMFSSSTPTAMDTDTGMFRVQQTGVVDVCIKRLNLNNKVRLADAEFIWTEPHSKRIKVKVKVRKEVLNGVILEQGYVAEYVLQDHMCEVCSRVAANPDQWVAAVQLRQHVGHRRTLFYLEQLIIKHDAAVKATKIKQMEHGIDFFFANRSHGLKFVEFVGEVVPVKSRSKKQLVSHDTKSQTYNYKHMFSVEICEICREDLICLPPKVANSLGNLGPLVLCTKVSNNIILVDPFTLRHPFLDADQYRRDPFKALISCSF
ncbi:hypothetical protein GIB67_009560 [Kingdonia uniflora]|uniref:60S ribosomal export protein NMD3 n=1 Tax=Kingdonia uniflora TaxID=39325 RepID=A0A7J7NW88_9MAGN|nr:hypothetical protein GIB67_009560 [Kingdonia uniflora]